MIDDTTHDAAAAVADELLEYSWQDILATLRRAFEEHARRDQERGEPTPFKYPVRLALNLSLDAGRLVVAGAVTFGSTYKREAEARACGPLPDALPGLAKVGLRVEADA